MEAWDLKPLEKIVALQRGFDLPTDRRTSGNVAVIGANGIVGTHDTMPAGIPVPGLMVGRSGSVGKLTYWDREYWPLNTSLYVKDFHGNDPKFLSYWLQLFPFKQYAEGVSVPTLNRNSVSDVLFPMPGKGDQKTIASALDVVARGVELQVDLVTSLHELKRAAMRELFTRGLRGEAQKDSEIGLLPSSWNVVPLGTLGKIGGGTTPNRSRTEFWDGGTIPWITSGKMYEREIWSSEVYVTPHGLTANSLPLLKPGALLIAIVGQGKTLGHCAILRIEATISRHVGYFQPDEALTTSGFIRAYLESIYDYLRQLASGNGSTRGALTAAILRDICIPVPPTLEEQVEISSILDAIEAKIALHQRKKIALEELLRGLLHKLMTGEIRVADLDLSVLQPNQEVAA